MRSPTISLSAFHECGLAANMLANLLVAMVMMTTLIVAPFYLGLALGLPQFMVGLVMSVGPVISIASGVPSGWLVDRWGPRRVILLGLIALTVGSFALATAPHMFSVLGYVAGIAVLTPGYQLFQAANNTAVMADVKAEQRGVTSGLLGLSRNLGLVAGSIVMGAIFASCVGTSAIETAEPDAVARGMRVTFVVACVLMIFALWMSCRTDMDGLGRKPEV